MIILQCMYFLLAIVKDTEAIYKYTKQIFFILFQKIC